MSRKKLRRRRAVNVGGGKSVSEFKKEVETVYKELFTSIGLVKAVDLTDLVHRAREWVDWFRAENLSAEIFLLTEWGEIALNSVWDLTHTWGLGKEGLKDVEENIQISMVAHFLGIVSFFWEMVSGLSYPKKIRERPYEGEDLFHFLSTATFRYQFIYRSLEMRYKDDPAARHAICRLLLSITDSIEDQNNDKITAHIMTEMWLSGINNFLVSEELREKFLLTDVSSIDANTVQFPYPAFSVNTPFEDLMFTTTLHPEKNIRVWVLYSREQGVVQLSHSTEGEVPIKELWDNLPPDFWNRVPEAEKACKEAFQIIANLLLYLQTDQAEVERRVPKRMSKPNPDNRKEFRRYGKNKMTPITHRLYPSLSSARSSTKVAGDSRGVKEHWVRGHYRWQAYWPDGRSNPPVNKRIWIEPHLRGGKVENREMKSRRYKV